MEYGSRTSLTLFVMLAWGCGSDDPGGSGGGTDSDEGTATEMLTGSTGSTAPTSVNTDSATGESSESSSEGSSSGGPSEVMLGGHTQDFIGAQPIPGASIRVFGMDSLTDVSDDMGAFTVGPLPADTPVALVLDALTVDTIDYVGAIIPERTGLMDRNDVDATQINQQVIDTQIMYIQDQMPQMANLDEAIVVVMVNPFAGGESLDDGTVTVDMQPAPEMGTYYAPDASGNPVLNTTEIGYRTIPAAVFFNLADTQPGEISVTAAHSVPTAWECTVDHPEWPTLGSYTTLVLVTCAPP